MTAPGNAIAGTVEPMSLAVRAALSGHRGANPLVGAVVTAPDGTVLATGFHRGRGTAHAEVSALERFAAASRIPQAGATLWVTLEPCDHFGSTGPCTEAILASGIRRVRYAVADPTGPDGGGAARLRRSGLDVEQLAPDATAASGADGLNPRWLQGRESGRPFVTAHLAQSLDGRVAAADGTSQWITGIESRRHAHAVRSRVDAIVVGTGTVAADDPRLTARNAAGQDLPLQPVPVVQGRRGVPGDAALRSGPEGGPRDWIHVLDHEPQAVLDRLAESRISWPHGGARPGHVLIEGGPTVLAAWLGAGLVDEMFVYQAPLVLGGGPTGLDLPQLTTLTQAVSLQLDPAENGALSRLGEDVLLHYAAH
ncbi:bifunctional diaminohydroxyphosphoribosylaminopyrimidine deaminase/5-amino-6-(5-phosphoribosylamino)uracil reductase RibD [Citricoccus nitrophenolicus]|uniref:bifunctional diaminohydroxyphosphoribosylaminopyrimidine deaminase/5-amino-6-(5-phosphoribosylamino)uracil reductase RibD n=1 Tax=Citricoccus nitrophenolicus TaxID=863575 RepID=UPI0031E60033